MEIGYIDSATLVGIGTIITAIVGPLLGVYVANMFSQRDSKRQEAARLFRRITEDAQSFRHSFLDVHQYRQEITKQTAQRNEIQRQIHNLSIVFAIEGKGSDLSLENQLNNANQELHRLKEHYAVAFGELRRYEAILNADVLSLGLLFDKQSEKSGRAIQELIVMGELFTREELPPRKDCRKRLVELINRISQELKPLHNSLARPGRPKWISFSRR